jgi:hypothetical protein
MVYMYCLQGPAHNRRVVRLALLFCKQAIDDQEDDGTDGGNENAAEVEGGDFPKTDEGPEEAADNSASHPDEDGDEDSTRVFPGHDELCESPGDEAEEDPGDYTHMFLLVGGGRSVTTQAVALFRLLKSFAAAMVKAPMTAGFPMAFTSHGFSWTVCCMTSGCSFRA